MRSLEQAIRDHLDAYLSGEVSLDAFKEWMIGVTWNRDDALGSDARQLAYAIELALAEESGGYLTREELHADLRQILERSPVNVEA
jgi:hypothetical protein